MKLAIKYLIITFLGFLLLSQKDQDLEKRAFEYFVINLLDKEDVFFEVSKGNKMPPGGMVPDTYKQGLFYNRDIYYSGKVDFLSETFFDSLRISSKNSLIRGDDFSLARDLASDFKFKSKSFVPNEVDISTEDRRVKTISYEQFCKKDSNSDIFVSIGKRICSGETCFVQLKFFLSEDVELEESYDFYFIFDQTGKVYDWFAK